jgi:DNA-binding transcriptional LysR family regulator
MERALSFNLKHLDATVAVGRHGSISAASQAVHLSQPALTQAVSKLEATLGHRLFDRLPGGVAVTRAGEIFLPRARWAIEEVAEGARAVRRSARLKPIAYPERVLSMAQLRALLAVEQAGSYSVGGRSIGLSQPSVRRAVKEIELTLGAPLLVRAGRAMRATTAAERLLRSIRLAIAELDAGLDELDALLRAGAGRLRIGALPLPRAGLLPRALSRFALSHPSAVITVIEGGYGELSAELSAGGLDLIVGALRDPAPSPDLTEETLFVDDLHVVARSGHPLAGGGELSREAPSQDALATYPWVLGARGAPMRNTWEALFAGGPAPGVRIECASILIARGLLIDGDWLALMSPDQFRIEQAAGLLTAIGPAIAGSGRKIGVTTRRDWRPTPTQAAFLAALREAGAER